MFEKIIEEERIVNWNYGEVQEAVYPLEHLDSIEPTTGKVFLDFRTRNGYGRATSLLSLFETVKECLTDTP